MDIVMTCFLNASGLSRVAREYFKLFDQHGFRVVVSAIMAPEPAGIDEDVLARMIEASHRPITDSFVQIHVGGLPQGLRYISGRKAFLGSTVFEGSSLTKDQYRACMTMDSVMTPSFFCRNACVSSGIPRKKVAYVPYVLDTSVWHPGVKPTIPKGDRFKFLFLNTWYERKGYDVLLRAWWNEFTRDDPVELVIKSLRENTREEPLEQVIALLADKWNIDRTKTAPIRIVDEVINDKALPGFMKSHDAYVSPHRSEGFGMNPWYCLALGVPVICTAYGGVLDFCKDETAWLVPPSGMVKPSEKETALFTVFKDIYWAEPDVMRLRTMMRECAKDTLAREQRAQNGAELVAAKFSNDYVMGCFQEATRSVAPEIWAKLSASRTAMAIANQPSPRYEPGKKIRLVEI